MSPFEITGPAFIVPMEPCIPVNDVFTKPLKPIIDTISGAFGGLIFPLTILMIVVIGAFIVVMILSPKAKELMKAMASSAAIPFAVILVLIFATALFTRLNNSC